MVREKVCSEAWGAGKYEYCSEAWYVRRSIGSGDDGRWRDARTVHRF